MIYAIQTQLINAGGKGALAKRIKESDVYFMTTVHKRLNPANHHYVESVRGGVVDNEDLGTTQLACIGNVAVTKKIIRQLRTAVPVREDFMTAACALLSKRDERIVLAHKDVNSQSNQYELYKSSLFCTSELLRLLESNPTVLNLDRFLRAGVTWNSIHRIYIFINEITVDNNTCSLLVLDLTNNNLYYLDPTYDVTQPAPAILVARMQHLSQMLVPFIRTIKADNNIPRIDCKLYPYQFGTVVSNDFDSGIYIFIAAYCMVYDCPLCWKENDMPKLRNSICYWLLKESLPI